MRTVFIGSSTFSHRCLESVLLLKDIQLVGIITNASTFTISYAPQGVKNFLHVDLALWAKQHGLVCYVMQEKMTEPPLMEQLREWRPELIIVAGWYHLLPTLMLRSVIAVGLHASLLPDYSGGSPLVWAMINGEKKTGISLFRLTEKVDQGPLIAQASTDILPEDTIATLYERITELGAQLLKEYLPRIAKGTMVYLPKDETKHRTFPPRKPQDGRIDWGLPAQKIYDFIRAQTHPYPGAYTSFNKKIVPIWAARLSSSNSRLENPPGSVYRTTAGVIRVNCGMNTTLDLISVGIGIGDEDVSAEDWFSEIAAQKNVTFE